MRKINEVNFFYFIKKFST